MMPGITAKTGRWLPILGIGLVWLAAVGCGGQKLYPVEGQVVFEDDETPLPGGWITYDPLDSGVMQGASADIEPDGHFKLGTFHPGDGAMEGRYRVVIRPPLRDARSRKNNPLSEVIDPVYQEFKTSPLEFPVTNDATQNRKVWKVKRGKSQPPRPK